MTARELEEELIVFERRISIPSKALPAIKRRKLAVNDITENTDEFTRLNFELQDGDVVQVIRSRPHPAPDTASQQRIERAIAISKKLIQVLATAERENQPEWMDYVFDEVIPEAEKALALLQAGDQHEQ